MSRHSLSLALALILAGCVVGPDYAGPPDVAPAATSRGAFASAGDFAPAPPQAAWWRGLGDPDLDRFVERALVASTDIEAATARVAAARAVLRERRGETRLEGGASAAYRRTRPAIGGFGVDAPGFEPRDIDLVELSLDASWEIDFAGRRRRALEEARAAFGASTASLEDSRVRVAAETALAYLAIRAADQALRLNAEDARLQSRMLALVRDRRALGAAADLDVARAETQLSVTRARREPLIAERTRQVARLAVLVGQEPGAFAIPPIVRPSLPPPATIAIGDPAELLRRRPDVRAAERELAAATAGIGVATADLYPRVSLLGSAGVQNAGFSNLDQGFTYRIGPSLSWNFLELDRVRARIAQADARRAERLALYRTVVLEALEDAEASLVRHRQAQLESALRVEAAATAGRAAELAMTRYRLGGSLLDALDAERQRVEAERASLDAATAVSNAYVHLHKALGLAWSPTKPQG